MAKINYPFFADYYFLSNAILYLVKMGILFNDYIRNRYWCLGIEEIYGKLTRLKELWLKKRFISISKMSRYLKLLFAQVNAKLPMSVNKFIEPAEMNAEAFFTRWKNLSLPQQVGNNHYFIPFCSDSLLLSQGVTHSHST